LCNCGLRFSMSRAALRSAICNFTGLLSFFHMSSWSSSHSSKLRSHCGQWNSV